MLVLRKLMPIYQHYWYFPQNKEVICNKCLHILKRNISNLKYWPNISIEPLPGKSNKRIQTPHPGFTSKNYSQQTGEPIILGIETSCDDTGVAIVNGASQILGECLFSQTKYSVRFGGVFPSISNKLHQANIEKSVKNALEQAKLNPSDITAFAATVKPGNRMNLAIGTNYAKDLCIKYGKPFIPIHHMEAHALTIRMINQVDFPFLVLLISGGHCILVLAKDIDEWLIVGETIDESPGVCFDQVARRMKLRNLKGFEEMCGGKAIETLAREGDHTKFEAPLILQHSLSTMFSFSGLKSNILTKLQQMEKAKGIEGGRVLEEIGDLCATFQYFLTKHLIRQTHIAMKFIRLQGLLPENKKTLVISGGVASNQYIRSIFQLLCEDEDYTLLVPPPNLCTDNGIMIAWNGVERWKAQKGILYTKEELDNCNVESTCALGPNLYQEIRTAYLSKPKYIKF